MSNILTYASLSILLFIFSCTVDSSTKQPCDQSYGDWQLEQSISKTVENVNFVFPTTGSAFNNKDVLIDLTMQAIEDNSQLLKIGTYGTPIKVRFVATREDMKKYSGIPASGATNSFTKEVHMLFPDSVTTIDPEHFTTCPIKHELMHMIAQTTWGYPHEGLTWMNEGLATFAENNCSGYTVGQLYRYFLEHDMLLDMDSLSTNFYQTDEMIAYHQCGYIVQYLMGAYGVNSIKALWQQDFSKFEEIFGLSSTQLVETVNKFAIEQYPTAPDIDWNTLKEGCK